MSDLIQPRDSPDLPRGSCWAYGPVLIWIVQWLLRTDLGGTQWDDIRYGPWLYDLTCLNSSDLLVPVQWIAKGMMEYGSCMHMSGHCHTRHWYFAVYYTVKTINSVSHCPCSNLIEYHMEKLQDFPLVMFIGDCGSGLLDRACSSWLRVTGCWIESVFGTFSGVQHFLIFTITM